MDGPLDAYRKGAAAPMSRGQRWATLGRTTGVTCHRMVAKVDAGDIVDSCAVRLFWLCAVPLLLECLVPAAPDADFLF